jgi:hypothetical protein
MILRRFKLHVKEQNWFAVGLDVLVVIFGVYIGIYLGEVASERATRVDVQDALELVRVQLLEDLKAVDTIIAYRQNKLKEPKLLLPLISRDDMDKELVGQKLTEAFDRMFTFFPKSSGYGSMKDSGYLARLDDPQLLEALANLFDQVYVRHVVIADESDEYASFFVRNFIVVYWNIDEPGFIGDEAIARARIKNAVVQFASVSEWYVQFLSASVRPAIADAITAIESYQDL